MLIHLLSDDRKDTKRRVSRYEWPRRYDEAIARYAEQVQENMEKMEKELSELSIEGSAGAGREGHHERPSRREKCQYRSVFVVGR